MHTVRTTGWRPDLRKVGMTRAIHLASGLTIGAANGCTDRVLEGETVAVAVPDADTACRLERWHDTDPRADARDDEREA